MNAYLQLDQRKAPSSSNAAVVLDRRTSNDGAEFVNWTRSDGSGLLHASDSATFLLSRLLFRQSHDQMAELIKKPD